MEQAIYWRFSPPIYTDYQAIYGDVNEACARCSGKGFAKTDKKISVRIPKGIVSGQTITIDGMGELGTRGGPRGDLIVKVSVLPKYTF